MVKRLYVLSLVVAAISVATTISVEAREFRYGNQRDDELPVVKTTKREVAAPSKTKPTSAGVVVNTVGSGTTKSVYAALLKEQTLLSEQIGVLSTQLQGASKAKAKKISAQINDLTSKLGAVQRRLDSFPESIKNPGNTVMEVDEEFNRQMDALAAQMNAAADPFAGQISSDPELEAMYRQYLSENNNGAVINAGDGLVYRVMIAISKNALPKSAFKGLTDILEQRMNNGGVIYYQGSYATQQDAQNACNMILSQRKFRDAFVVAMQGDRRVPIK